MHRSQKAPRAIALLLICSVAHIYIQATIAGPVLPSSPSTVDPPQRQIVARLVTRNNQPITVNSISATTGSSILTGATIETPDAVGATIDLGPLGTLDLAPNTIVQVDFSDGNVKVKIRKGCVILKTKKDVNGTVDTGQGPPTTTDKNKGVADVCFPGGGGSQIVNQGAALNAGAGAGVGPVTTAATTGGGFSVFGLGRTGSIALLALLFGGAAIPIIEYNSRGRNPSPFR